MLVKSLKRPQPQLVSQSRPIGIQLITDPRPAKALELFMIALVSKGAAEAKANGSKRVTAQHLKAGLMKDGQYDFLTDICESVPDEGSKKGRAKSEAKSEDSDDDIAPKKKGKAGGNGKLTLVMTAIENSPSVESNPPV